MMNAIDTFDLDALISGAQEEEGAQASALVEEFSEPETPAPDSEPVAASVAGDFDARFGNEIAELALTIEASFSGAKWRVLNRALDGASPERRAEVYRMVANLGLAPDDPAMVAAVFLGHVAALGGEIPKEIHSAAKEASEVLVDAMRDGFAEVTAEEMEKSAKAFEAVVQEAVKGLRLAGDRVVYDQEQDLRAAFRAEISRAGEKVDDLSERVSSAAEAAKKSVAEAQKTTSAFVQGLRKKLEGNDELSVLSRKIDALSASVASGRLWLAAFGAGGLILGFALGRFL